MHPHVGLAAAGADTWLNATPRAERSALSKPRIPPYCGSWGEKRASALRVHRWAWVEERGVC